MSDQQGNCTMTIAKSLEDLERATQEITQAAGVKARAHGIIREIQKARIIEIAARNKRRTGHYLPKDQAKRLADKFNYSEKWVQDIVYSHYK